MKENVQETQAAQRREAVTKVSLTAFFLLLFVLAAYIFAGKQAAGRQPLTLGWLDLALLGLATLRLGRLVAYARVMEPLRQPFAVTLPDPTGAGDTVEPRGSGVRGALGQLLVCPICAGTWMAALLVYGLYALPAPTRLFLWMTAAISLAELLNAMLEALSWGGQYARTQAGAEMLKRRRIVYHREVFVVPDECEEDDLAGKSASTKIRSHTAQSGIKSNPASKTVSSDRK